MSVIIKGMEMPVNCQNCFSCDDWSRFCRAAKEYIPMLGKPKFCPLEEVKEPSKQEMEIKIEKEKAELQRLEFDLLTGRKTLGEAIKVKPRRVR